MSLHEAQEEMVLFKTTDGKRQVDVCRKRDAQSLYLFFILRTFYADKTGLHH